MWLVWVAAVGAEVELTKTVVAMGMREESCWRTALPGSGLFLATDHPQHYS